MPARSPRFEEIAPCSAKNMPKGPPLYERLRTALPIEIVIAASFLFVTLSVGLAFGLPFNLPNSERASFVGVH